MEYEVKVGDYVRCIKSYAMPGDLTVGSYYRVLKIFDGIYYIQDNSGGEFGYYYERFELSIKHLRMQKLEKLKSISDDYK